MTMPECTKAERDLLDALNGNPDMDINEALAALAISRVTPELLEEAISARVRMIEAHARDTKVWKALNALGVQGVSRAFNGFYEMIDKAANERVKA
jgi:predicted RNA-binding protein associated with RNAse of E/G family